MPLILPEKKKGIRGRDAIALRSIAVGIADTPPLMPLLRNVGLLPTYLLTIKKREKKSGGCVSVSKIPMIITKVRNKA